MRTPHARPINRRLLQPQAGITLVTQLGQLAKRVAEQGVDFGELVHILRRIHVHLGTSLDDQVEARQLALAVDPRQTQVGELGGFELQGAPA